MNCPKCGKREFERNYQEQSGLLLCRSCFGELSDSDLSERVRVLTINKETSATRFWRLRCLISYINADRSANWESYDETDWQQGLREFTRLRVVSIEYQE